MSVELVGADDLWRAARACRSGRPAPRRRRCRRRGCWSARSRRPRRPRRSRGSAAGARDTGRPRRRRSGRTGRSVSGVRTICVDEMLVTLPIARWAMPVRSGSAGRRGRRCGAAGCLRPAASAAPARREALVRGAHAAGEHQSGHEAERDRRDNEEQASEHGSVLRSADFDLARRRRRTFGRVTVSTPSARSAAMRSPSIVSANSKMRLKRAVAALDLMIMNRVAGRRPGLATCRGSSAACPRPRARPARGSGPEARR